MRGTGQVGIAYTEIVIDSWLANHGAIHQLASRIEVRRIPATNDVSPRLNSPDRHYRSLKEREYT